MESDAGLVDLLRAGASPLDFDSVDAAAIEATVDDVLIRVCGLASLVAFKRLAGRSRDRLDLEELRERHGGVLPLLDLPGLDESGLSATRGRRACRLRSRPDPPRRGSP